MKKSTNLSVLALMFVLSESRAQNLITNGGFEALAHSPGSITGLAAGSGGIPGWSIEGVGTFFLITAPLSSFQAKEGSQFVSFNYHTAALSQILSTVPGESYDLGFSVGYYQGHTNMAVTATVFSESGLPLGLWTVDALSNVGWRPPVRFRFTATSSSSRLEFRGTNATPNVDLLLDDVSVEPAAQPLSIGIANVRICWDSKSNRTYQVQYRSALTTNLWTDLGASVAGTGSSICSIQSNTEPQRFFRVITLP